MTDAPTTADKHHSDLRARLAMVGELAAGVAHELSNPLTGIMGYASLLAADPDAPDRRDCLNKIVHEADRAGRIIRNLLSLARDHPPTRTMTDLNKLVRDTLELQSYHLRTHNVEVIERLDPTLPMTAVDPREIQQVLLNLLLNAQHAIPASRRIGHVTLTTTHNDHVIELCVADDGVGMPDTVRKHVFDPFFTTKGDTEGTGLGLPLSRSIVREHGGDLHVASEPGQGSVFSIALPIVTVESAAQTATPTHAGELTALHWLVVDDEETVLDALRYALEAEGQKVTTARSGAEAIACLDAHAIDYVVTDIRMPDMSGADLQAHIRERFPALSSRVVLCTGDLLSADSQALLAASPLPVFEKPFEFDLLRAAIQSLIAAGRTTPQPNRPT